MANGERDWEHALPSITLAYNAAGHASTGCSPARGFLGREVEVPHLTLLPRFDNPEQQVEPCGLEEDMDRVWEEMRMADDVRIRRQFQAYSARTSGRSPGGRLCVCSGIATSYEFEETDPLVVRTSSDQ